MAVIVADEVALSGSTEDYGVRDSLLDDGFIYDDDRTYLILDDGKVDTVANKPEWKEGLAYVKSLVDEGLIDPGAFTQNAEAFKKIGDNADAESRSVRAPGCTAIFITTGNIRRTLRGRLQSAATAHRSPCQLCHLQLSQFTRRDLCVDQQGQRKYEIAAIKLVDYIPPKRAAAFHFGVEGGLAPSGECGQRSEFS
ncbi:MAG: hypothetical protein R2867_21625 [Caldilineaceae bacterium]